MGSGANERLERVARDAAIKKVPGEVAPLGRLGHETGSFESQLRRMALPELKDALARQEGLLANTALCRTLPDKGERVKKRKKQIQVSST